MTTIVTQGGPGTWTITDDTSAAIIAQTLVIEKAWGAAGLGNPLSPVSLMREQTDALSDIAAMLANISKKQTDLEAQLTAIRGSISNVSSGVHAAVTTSQIAVADQIKNNQFNQQTTNAALERADLPKTEVNLGDLQTRFANVVADTTDFKSQVYAANLVEEQIGKAASWTSDIVSDVIKDSFIGQAASSIQTTIKGWFAKSKIPEKAVEIKSQTRSGKMLSPPLPPDPFDNIA